MRSIGEIIRDPKIQQIAVGLVFVYGGLAVLAWLTSVWVAITIFFIIVGNNLWLFSTTLNAIKKVLGVK